MRDPNSKIFIVISYFHRQLNLFNTGTLVLHLNGLPNMQIFVISNLHMKLSMKLVDRELSDLN